MSPTMIIALLACAVGKAETADGLLSETGATCTCEGNTVWTTEVVPCVDGFVSWTVPSKPVLLLQVWSSNLDEGHFVPHTPQNGSPSIMGEVEHYNCVEGDVWRFSYVLVD